MRRLALVLSLLVAPTLVLPPEASLTVCLCRGFVASLLDDRCGGCRDEEDVGLPAYGDVGADACMVIVSTPPRDPAPPTDAPAVAPEAPPVAATFAVLATSACGAALRPAPPAPPPDPAATRSLPRTL